MKRIIWRFGMLAQLLFWQSQAGFAGPWADPGDMRLRQDVQMLNDAGVIDIPTNTWPLSFPDISGRLMSADGSRLSPEIRAVLERVRKRIEKEMRHGFSDPGLRVAGAYNPLQLRTFEYTPRGTGEMEAHVAWLGDYVAGRLNLTGVPDPEDSESLRFDGSYLTLALGNWNLSFGQQARWWGPGWDTSLILSTNARPVPALGLERNYSTPFESPWLNWLGPWKLSTFIGQLEHFGEAERDRLGFISDAKFFGARLTFKPMAKLEIGLARTAFWGGKGRSETAGSFFDLLAGNDNEGPNQPGNQLAGYDLRWRSPLFGDFPYAVYSQFIGEDYLAGLPHKYIGQAGLEIWGTSRVLSGTWRAYFEWSDTLASFYSSVPDFNIAYNHHIYRQGYRYHDRSLGAAMDNDGRMFSLGVVLAEDDGATWNALFRNAGLNRDGAGYNPVSGDAGDIYSMYLSNRQRLWKGDLTFGLGGQIGNTRLMGRNQDFQLFTQYDFAW